MWCRSGEHNYRLDRRRQVNHDGRCHGRLIGRGRTRSRGRHVKSRLGDQDGRGFGRRALYDLDIGRLAVPTGHAEDADCATDGKQQEPATEHRESPFSRNRSLFSALSNDANSSGSGSRSDFAKLPITFPLGTRIYRRPTLPSRIATYTERWAKTDAGACGMVSAITSKRTSG